MSRRKKKTLKDKRAMTDSSAKQNSTYARKRAYLNKHGGWGFNYPDKPWKSSKAH